MVVLHPPLEVTHTIFKLQLPFLDITLNILSSKISTSAYYNNLNTAPYLTAKTMFRRLSFCVSAVSAHRTITLFRNAKKLPPSSNPSEKPRNDRERVHSVTCQEALDKTVRISYKSIPLLITYHALFEVTYKHILRTNAMQLQHLNA